MDDVRRARERRAQDRAWFCNGPITVTEGAREICRSNGVSPFGLVNRHVGGEFGAISEATRRANEQAMRMSEIDSMARGGVVISSFAIGQEEVWVLTDRRKGRTSVLLPSEYSDAASTDIRALEHG